MAPAHGPPRLALPWLLILPFIGKLGSYPINHPINPSSNGSEELDRKNPYNSPEK